MKLPDPFYVDLAFLGLCVGLTVATVPTVLVPVCLMLGYVTGFRVRRWWTF